jgi:hypothetical protein
MLNPVGCNEMLGSPLDVSLQPALWFSLLSFIHLNCFVLAKRPTPELTRREALREASDLANDSQAHSARVE